MDIGSRGDIFLVLPELFFTALKESMLCSFGTATSVGSGANVNVYVVDSGIRRSHQEFRSWSNDTIRAFFG